MVRKQLAIWLILFSITTLRAQIIDTVCTGKGSSVYAVDHTPGSIYKWEVSGGEIISGNGTHQIVVNWRKKPGLFPISVTEQNVMGCWGEPQKSLVWLRGPEFTTRFPDRACLFDSVSIEASGGLTYQWNNGLTDSTIRIKLVGDTTLKVFISDTTCGFNTDSFDVLITASSKPITSITAEQNSVFKNQPVTIFYHGDATNQVSWHIDKPNIKTLNGQSMNVRFTDTGEAIIRVISVNQLGCKDSGYTYMDILNEELYFPTAFTPDADGLNDVFRPGGLGSKEYQLRIFNRWGQLVFYSTDIAQGWDGKMDGLPAQSDVYIYQCDLTGQSGKKYAYAGNVTLIR